MNQLYFEKFVRDDKCDWLVFLHGFGGSTQMWKRQIDCFKEKYNLLIIDLPGHGKSKEGIANKGIKSFEGLADTIVDLLKEEKIKIATFICVSLGTLVFAGIFAKYPEIVKGVVLCGAITGMGIWSKALLKLFDKIKSCLPYMTSIKLLSKVLLPLKAHKKSREFFINSSKLMGRSEFLAWFELLAKDVDALKNLTLEKTQALFIMGNEDFTFINGVKHRIKKVNDAKLKILNRCGHVCNIQKWKDFNETALEFVEAVA